MLQTLRKPRRKPVHIGPEDHGRPMSLERFDRAAGREGHLYELSKGVIEVIDVSHPDHAMQVQEIRDQVSAYRFSHPGVIHFVGSSGEAKILLATDQSERHPDLSIYLTRSPGGPDVWSIWVPEIVVEVVSRSSAKRDYEDKPDEYLGFGVKEYWIVDPFKRQMTALIRWQGQWTPKVVKPPQKHTTRYLPGFALDVKRIFAAKKDGEARGAV